MDTGRSIEEVASEWLAAEARASTSGNAGSTELFARHLSDQYDRAIQTATLEELRLAWEAAVKQQGEREIGSAEWLGARRVAELLRAEYLAARDGAGSDLSVAPEAGEPQP
jgi:hypothetical protein